MTLPVDQPRQVGVVAECRGEQVRRETLVGHGPEEAGDGVGADRRRGRGGRRGVRAAVLLGVGDRDAGRPAVPQHPAGLEGERVPQRSNHRVVVGTDDRCGELAVDRLGHRQQFVLIVVRRDERRGTEAFAEHLVSALPQVGQQVGRRGGQQRRAGRVGIGVAGPQHRHRRLGSQPPQALDVPLLDPGIEQRGRSRQLRLREPLDDRAVAGHQQHPRFGAELPGAQRERRDELRDDLVGSALRRSLGDEHRVHAAQLTVERDGLGPLARDVEQRPAAGDGSGERRRLDLRCPQRRHPGVGPEDEAEHAIRCPGVGQGPLDDRGGRCRELWMARMGLDHDRAPGRQRRGRVAAGDAEGEWEVAGGEDQDRAERVQDPPQVRTRCTHRPVRVGVVDPDIQVGAVVHDVGEQPQLEGRAPQLAAQPRLAEVRLPDADRHQLVGRRVELVGHRPQGLAPGRPIQPRPWPGGTGSGGDDLLDLGDLGVPIRSVHGGHPRTRSASDRSPYRVRVAYLYPRPMAASVAAVTWRYTCSGSGPRGGRQTPPLRPATSMLSLMAWTNSVLASQRSSECRSR